MSVFEQKMTQRWAFVFQKKVNEQLQDLIFFFVSIQSIVWSIEKFYPLHERNDFECFFLSLLIEQKTARDFNLDIRRFIRRTHKFLSMCHSKEKMSSDSTMSEENISLFFFWCFLLLVMCHWGSSFVEYKFPVVRCQ